MTSLPPHSHERLQWIDATRALCVFAVVLLHFDVWVFAPTRAAHPEATAHWEAVSSVLVLFRMPLLFVVSGLLVGDRLRRGWRERRNVSRAVSSYYLYVVWVVVYALLTFLWPGATPGGVTPADYATELFLPTTSLWFILFLAVGVVIFTTLRRVHPAVVLLSLAMVSAGTTLIDFDDRWMFVGRGFYYLLYFALGVYLKPLWIQFAQSGLWWKAPATVALLVLANDAYYQLEWRSPGWVGMYIGLDVIGVFTGISVVALICRLRPVARGLAWLGRRTLVVYVLHVPVLWVVLFVVTAIAGDTIDHPLALAAGPAVAAIVVVAVCVGLGAILQRLRGARALFTMPPVLKKRLERADRTL